MTDVTKKKETFHRIIKRNAFCGVTPMGKNVSNCVLSQTNDDDNSDNQPTDHLWLTTNLIRNFFTTDIVVCDYACVGPNRGSQTRSLLTSGGI